MRADAAANRERILAAAEEVFGAQGGAGSTEEVAARAGVGIGTVFRHFPTKSELIEAALLRHFDRLEAEVRAAGDGAPSADRALFDSIELMVRTGSTKLTLASLLDSGDFPASVHASSNRVRALVRDLIARAAEDGAVRADVTVDEVYLLIRSLAQTSAVAPPTAAALDAAIDIVCRGLRR